MSDLAAFLRARLDEDEQTALDWQRHKSILTDQFMKDPRRQQVRVRREPVTDARLSEYAYHERFDPARVLREVEAKRQIITEHYVAQGIHEGRALKVCTRCSDYAERGEVFRPELAPCRTLRLLAESYVDHADYREEWRP